MENFILPPKNHRNFYVFLEILSASEFEISKNIHVRYHIKMPSEIQVCQGKLYGSTQTSIKYDHWNFGYSNNFMLCIPLEAVRNDGKY